MAVKIRLKRMGKIRQPYYRIVVADSRTKRDGRVIEEIGKYHPKEDPSFIEVKSERALYWLGVGAQPSEPVAAILKITGDWQKFKGEAAPAPMKVAEARRDKTEIFNEALQDAQSEPKTEAVTAKKTAAKKTAKAPAAEAESPTAEVPVAKAPVAEAAVAEPPAAEASAAETQTPVDETPVDETPDEEAPVEESSPVADEATAESAEADDTPDDTPDETAAVDEAPVPSRDETTPDEGKS